MSKKVRVGMIGAGGIATNAHIPGYKKLLDQVELVAVADVNGERAEKVAAEHGFARAYSDAATMLASEQLDAISVCTPNKFHASSAIAALQAGVHVLCEKPPGLNVAEVEAMAAAATASGKTLTFGFHNRFRPEAQAAQRFMQAGELGEIYAGRVTYIRRRGIPGWGVFTNKELQGGGSLIDIGVHMLDCALWLMGYPEPDQVLGATYQKIGRQKPGAAPWGPWDYENFQVEDMANAMITFKNGAHLLLESSFAANIEPMEEMNVRLQGDQGGLTLLPFKVHKEMHGTLLDLTPAWLPQNVHAHALEIAHFVQVVQGEAEPISRVDEAIKLQRIIDAIYRSAEGRRAESV